MDVRTADYREVVIAPPYQASYYRYFEPCRVLHLSLSPELLVRAAGVEGPRARLRNSFGELDLVVREMGKILLDYVKTPGPKAREFLEWFGMGVATRLLERFAENETPVKGKLSPAQMRQIHGCLERHLDGHRVSLEWIAGLLGMSPYHLHRLFKATLGMSPMQYMMQLRMRRARALLEGTRKPIGEIAAEIGCPDHSHFTKMFRKHWGVPPSQLRDYKP